jgi:hypothetical protein
MTEEEEGKERRGTQASREERRGEKSFETNTEEVMTQRGGKIWKRAQMEVMTQ